MSSQKLSEENVQKAERLINDLITFKPIGREEYDNAPVYIGERIGALTEMGSPVIPYLLPYFSRDDFQKAADKLGGPDADDLINFLQSSDKHDAKLNLMMYLAKHKDQYKRYPSLASAISEIARTDIPADEPNKEERMYLQILANKVLAEFGDHGVKDKLAQLFDDILKYWGEPDEKEGLLKVGSSRHKAHLLYRECGMALGICQAKDILLSHLDKVERNTRSMTLWGLHEIKDPALFNVYLAQIDREFTLGVGKFEPTFSSLATLIAESAASDKEKIKALKDILKRAQNEVPPDGIKSVERALEKVSKNKKGLFGLW